MLLSNQQKYIIAVLRQIKYIRSDQLRALTAQHYRPQGIEISQHRMDVMLRQLRTGSNFVRLQEDVACYGALSAPLSRERRGPFLSFHGGVDGYPCAHRRDTAHERGADHLDL